MAKSRKPTLTEASEALKIVTARIKNDKDYREGFQSTIAVMIQDEFTMQNRDNKNFTKYLFEQDGINEISNNAAKKFLDVLIQ